MDPKEFLRETKELKIVPFLAERSRRAHIVAPREIIEAVTAHNPEFRFTYSHDWRGITGAPDSIFVFDDADGYPSSLLRRRYPGKNTYVINFDIALRLACKEHKLKLWKPEPEYRYCLITTPRTGSTLLANLLSQLGVGNPTEHVRAPLVHIIKHGGYGFEKVLENLARIASRNEVFGTKFISTFLQYIFGDDGMEGLGEYLNAKEYKVVFLKRDLCDQAVSSYFAARTNVWHLFDKNKFSAKGDIPYDFSSINEIYQRFRKEERLVDQIAAAIPPHRQITILYEDLDTDSLATAGHVKTFVGAELPDSEVHMDKVPQKISGLDERIPECRQRFEHELQAYG
ncbi:MAG TPA: Stf0 family sulfotransferase [Rhizomicrobium sp.]|nr:Stf0 family sulfotransferase [Rhizomicrobium sp.]